MVKCVFDKDVIQVRILEESVFITINIINKYILANNVLWNKQ